MKGGFSARRVILGLFSLGGFAVLSHSAAFEPLGYGAAAKGMGGAYVALAEDGTAAYWNPAALALVKDPHFSASYEDLYGLGLLRSANGGYTHPNIAKGTLSAHLLHLDTQGDASFFKYAESTYLLAYGRELYKNKLSVGGGFRYYSAYGTDVKGTGLGFDVGALYRPYNDRLRIGLAWQDLNRPRIDWSTGARDTLPYTVRAGVAGRITKNTDLAGQVDKRWSERSIWRMGLAQRFFKNALSLRAGLHRAGGQDQWNPSVGGGIRHKNFDFDYAWDASDDLGNAQTFSINFRLAP